MRRGWGAVLGGSSCVQMIGWLQGGFRALDRTLFRLEDRFEVN